jgi:hypothetical protein
LRKFLWGEARCESLSAVSDVRAYGPSGNQTS